MNQHVPKVGSLRIRVLNQDRFQFRHFGLICRAIDLLVSEVKNSLAIRR